MQLTEQMVMNYFGNSGWKKVGQELVRECPICRDSHKDNMTYNKNKNILWCHADPSHAPLICKEIYKKNQPPKEEKQEQSPKYIKYAEELLVYWDMTHDMLMGNKVSKDTLEFVCDDEEEIEKYLKQQELNRSTDALNYLFQQRGLSPFCVIKSGLGYDFVDNKWVFPIRRLQDQKLVGFRYRMGNLEIKEVWTMKNMPSCLAIMYGDNKAENLYICEGEWDSLAMIEILDKYNKLDNATIIMPTNGVKTLLKHITDLELNNFDNVYLCLDNDKGKVNKQGKPDDVSWQTTQELLRLYPNFIDKTPTGCKDINDWWKEHRND